MKSLKFYFLTFIAVLLAGSYSVNAQEEESSSAFDTGFDIYTSYVWRGSKFGSGPAFQPWVETSLGDLTIGAWGSVNSSLEESFEMDLYLSYSFDFGLSLGVNDYYFGGDWMSSKYTHSIEPIVGFEAGDFTFTAAYMLLSGVEEDLTQGIAGVGFGEEGDIYLEAAYSFGSVDLAVGAGDGQYVSADDDFMICNITLGTSKEVAVTEKFTLPVSGAVTLNPSTGGFFITAGVSF